MRFIESFIGQYLLKVPRVRRCVVVPRESPVVGGGEVSLLALLEQVEGSGEVILCCAV